MRALAQPTKANLKKAKRAKRRSGAHADDDDDEYDSDGALAKGGSNFDPVSIDIALRSFVLDVRRSAFSLPPMSKRERVVVHLLADAYSLASTSRGSGAKRFTTVNRTSRTAVYGADAKVKRILDAAYKKSGGGFGGGRGSNRYNTMLDALDGGSRTIVPVKNREGDVVGRGASALENDNAGYALLAKMGWTQGQTLGLNQSGLKTRASGGAASKLIVGRHRGRHQDVQARPRSLVVSHCTELVCMRFLDARWPTQAYRKSSR